MNETTVIVVSLISVTVLLIAIIVVFGRLKIEQQRTLQKLLEKQETSPGDWERVVGATRPKDQDLRRGMLFIATGLALGGFFFMMGGVGWMFAGVPIAVGLVYLLLSKLNAPKG